MLSSSSAFGQLKVNTPMLRSLSDATPSVAGLNSIPASAARSATSCLKRLLRTHSVSAFTANSEASQMSW